MPRGKRRYANLLPMTLALSIASTSRPAYSIPENAPRHPVCKPGLEFWSPEKTNCSPCTICEPQFTLRPCVLHQDAVCGPLSALEIDWSFLASKKTSESKTAHRLENSKIDLNNNDFNVNWLTSSLFLAIFASLAIFVTVGCSALFYVRQWKKMERNLKSVGMEEFSTKLNLMVKTELGEVATPNSGNLGGPTARCQYLEQLLDWTGRPETGSNVYIEEGKNSCRNAKLSRIHRNIENIFNNKPRRER